jgi:hypothetical protein
MLAYFAWELTEEKIATKRRKDGYTDDPRPDARRRGHVLMVGDGGVTCL